jgi:hypothetical protein
VPTLVTRRPGRGRRRASSTPRVEGGDRHARGTPVPGRGRRRASRAATGTPEAARSGPEGGRGSGTLVYYKLEARRSARRGRRGGPLRRGRRGGPLPLQPLQRRDGRVGALLDHGAGGASVRCRFGAATGASASVRCRFSARVAAPFAPMVARASAPGRASRISLRTCCIARHGRFGSTCSDRSRCISATAAAVVWRRRVRGELALRDLEAE